MPKKKKLSKEDVKKVTGGLVFVHDAFCPKCGINLVIEGGRMFCPLCG